jgi:HEPN domain-containing protein
MKEPNDLARTLVRKAEEDLDTARILRSSGKALDSVGFHAQQSVEKMLKAFLASRSGTYPFIHDIDRLIQLCCEQDVSFRALEGLGKQLTPYAVELRYGDAQLPSTFDLAQVMTTAESIYSFVLERLPESLRNP